MWQGAAAPCASIALRPIRRYPHCGSARNAPLSLLQTIRLSSQWAIHCDSQPSSHFLIPNDPPQFARGHSLRLSRLSALRLVTDRCSLGSAIRTVHRTVLISAPTHNYISKSDLVKRYLSLISVLVKRYPNGAHLIQLFAFFDAIYPHTL